MGEAPKSAKESSAGRSGFTSSFKAAGAPARGGGSSAGPRRRVGIGRLLTTQLDAATFAAGSAALVVIALASSYLPARRALRIDAAAALRRE